MRTAAVTDRDMAVALAKGRAKDLGIKIRVYGTDQGLYFVDFLPGAVWGALTSVFDVDARGLTTHLPMAALGAP